MKTYLLTLAIVFASISVIVYGFLAFIYSTFDASAFHMASKAVAILVTVILTGILTDKLEDL